jgi:hypothetical protein
LINGGRKRSAQKGGMGVGGLDSNNTEELTEREEVNWLQ